MSARRTRRRASAGVVDVAAVLAVQVGVPLLAVLVRYALPLVLLGLVAAVVVAVARRRSRATAAYPRARKSRAGRWPAELLAEAQAAARRAAADAAAAERARAEAVAERDQAREAARRAWDAAADAGYAPPCPECGTLIAYLHDAGCTLAGGYQRRAASG